MYEDITNLEMKLQPGLRPFGTVARYPVDWSLIESIRSSDRNALDAGEHLVDGVRVPGLVEEQNQFQILDLDPFDCVRARAWSVA